MLSYKDATVEKLQEELKAMNVEFDEETKRSELWKLYKESYVEPETLDMPDLGDVPGENLLGLHAVAEPEDSPSGATEIASEPQEIPQSDSRLERLQEIAQKGAQELDEPLIDKMPPAIAAPVQEAQDIPSLYRENVGKILGRLAVVGKLPPPIQKFIDSGVVDHRARRVFQFWLKSTRNIRRMPGYIEHRHELPITAMEVLYSLFEGDQGQANKLYAKIPSLLELTKEHLSPANLARETADSDSWVHIK